ncbi:SMR family transporter [Rhizobium sp. LEGMi198b]|uniref:SMR family transporter n=1 Tax=unclassified Rhizobium TaxID=2613769 RepID=UPI000CDF2E5E|nr:MULTISPECIES: SMR family transporter [Rhizobium]AVA22542.1 small multidrug resistance protein [Rhizobium sp. NXC24]MDK4738446.1 SMR family transporter [Rhizobium sp. CNPSo 3464]UWU19930.1 SMR family transporter [Rhizobium tropici]WFU00753.1 SMR family transporter [Rhizobium sp. CB3171]
MANASVYAMLLVAIVLEVIGTTALQMSQQFTRLGPSIVLVLCYVAAFYFLSLTLRVIPVGIAYAIWSALGIVLISVVGLVFFRQKLDLAAIIGLGLIIAGVLVVNLFSKSVSH